MDDGKKTSVSSILTWDGAEATCPRYIAKIKVLAIYQQCKDTLEDTETSACPTKAVHQETNKGRRMPKTINSSACTGRTRNWLRPLYLVKRVIMGWRWSIRQSRRTIQAGLRGRRWTQPRKRASQAMQRQILRSTTAWTISNSVWRRNITTVLLRSPRGTMSR